MPKVADPKLRNALIETAARIIGDHGSESLSIRRLAKEVGTSTMAIYTHFGGMDELRRAVRVEGFARLAEHLSTVEDTGDTVADVFLLGRAYFLNAMENPHLYRAMFLEAVQPSEEAVGLETFERLVRGLDRCIKAGRLDPADPVDLAVQMWALTHGIVALELAGMLTPADATKALISGGTNLLRAFGDDPAALGRSAAAVRRRT